VNQPTEKRFRLVPETLSEKVRVCLRTKKGKTFKKGKQSQKRGRPTSRNQGGIIKKEKKPRRGEQSSRTQRVKKTV